MTISGYGLTLEGVALGSLSGIERLRVGGVALAFDEVQTIDAWRQGTATFTTTSASVTGVGTAWETAMAGRRIRLDADGVDYWILSVEGATALTLTAAYGEAGGSGAYTIWPSRLAEHVPLGVLEQPIEVDFCYDETLYDALRDAALAQTEDEFTLTDSESSVHVGDGRVSRCGDLVLGPDSHMHFTVTLTPTTQWEFTPSV
jgi:hypothetical protein